MKNLFRKRNNKCVHFVALFGILCVLVLLNGCYLLYERKAENKVMEEIRRDIELLQQWFPELAGIERAQWKTKALGDDKCFLAIPDPICYNKPRKS